MGSYMARHNSKVLKQESKQQAKPQPRCNCQKSRKGDCPVPGACNQDGVVYQATVTSDGGQNMQTYVGLAKSFKKRYSKHMSSIEKPIPTNSTTLSTHYLKEKSAGKNPSISWKFLKTNIPTFNPVTEICRLCLCEKFQILYEPKMATLNSRSEIFSACRHKKYELLVPPDPKSQGGWEPDLTTNPECFFVIFCSVVIYLKSGTDIPWNTV